MPIIDSSHPLAELLQKDQRYPLEAYIFILESLSFAQDSLGMGVEPPEDDVKTGGEKRSPGSSGGHSKLDRRRPERHLTGQELCEAARQYALQQYGFLACTVLATWGLRSTNDFGEFYNPSKTEVLIDEFIADCEIEAAKLEITVDYYLAEFI